MSADVEIWGGEDGIAALTTDAVHGVFGTPATYTSFETGQSYPIFDVFDEAHIELAFEGDGVVSTTEPVFDVRLDDLPVTPGENDTIEVVSQSTRQPRKYRVEDVRFDGQGGADLILGRVKP